MFYKPYHIYIDLLRRKHHPDQTDPLWASCSGTRYKTGISVSPGLKDRSILRNLLLPDTLSPAPFTLPFAPNIGTVRHHRGSKDGIYSFSGEVPGGFYEWKRRPGRVLPFSQQHREEPWRPTGGSGAEALRDTPEARGEPPGQGGAPVGSGRGP